MEFVIEKGETVLDLVHRFGEMYQGLKIEFFQKEHSDNESSSARMRINGRTPVEDIVSCELPCKIDLNSKMPVSDVENKFEEVAGLHMQVFRKMRGVWIETVQTDAYTLEKHMAISRNALTS